MRFLFSLALFLTLVPCTFAGPFRSHGTVQQPQITDLRNFVIPAETTDATDALDEVNASRASLGLAPFVRDDSLTEGAMRLASYRAANGIEGHTSNDFASLPAGASASACGCACRNAGEPFAACCVYEGYTYAGAASARGRDGRVYHHIVVRVGSQPVTPRKAEPVPMPKEAPKETKPCPCAKPAPTCQTTVKVRIRHRGHRRKCR